MSLVRGLTKRLQRTESKRPTISGPVNLISSTNMASYNAPDIESMKAHAMIETTALHQSPATPRSSGERSLRSDLSDSPATTEPTLTDGSSVETSPISSPTTEKNHLTSYFASPTQSKQEKLEVQQTVTSVDTTEVVDFTPTVSLRPALPQRAPSHSKREHEQLARKRSIRSWNEGQKSTSPLEEKPSTTSQTDSEHTPRPQHQSSPTLNSHPFSRELQQLNEVAEEFERDTREYEMDVDLFVMQRLNLTKFSAEDYKCLIVDPLSPGGMFDEADYRESCWI